MRRYRPPVVPAARPLVVAHRGASSALAEHTLDAYALAIESGADALECDVRMTSDGHLVCVHDRTVNRTSDGRGVVSNFALDRLEQLDFASWHERTPTGAGPGAEEREVGSADEFVGADGDPYAGYLSGVEPDVVRPGGRVLTLRRLLELVHDGGTPVRLLVETKHPTRYAGLVEKELVELLRHFGWADDPPDDLERALHAPPDLSARVTVMSFAMTAVKRVKLLSPSTPTVLLLDRLAPGRRVGLGPGPPSPGPRCGCCTTTPASWPGPTSGAIRCTSGPSTTPMTSPSSAPWGSTQSSPTGPTRCWPSSRHRAGTEVAPTDEPGTSRYPCRNGGNTDTVAGEQEQTVRAGQFSVRHEPASAALARHRLFDELSALGVAAAVIDDVTLIASELVTNAVRHTGNGASHIIDWQLAEHEIMVSVNDGSVVRPVIRDPDSGVPVVWACRSCTPCPPRGA